MMLMRRIVSGAMLLIVLSGIGYAWYWSWRISLAYWSTVTVLLWWWVGMNGGFDRR